MDGRVASGLANPDSRAAVVLRTRYLNNSLTGRDTKVQSTTRSSNVSEAFYALHCIALHKLQTATLERLAWQQGRHQSRHEDYAVLLWNAHILDMELIIATGCSTTSSPAATSIAGYEVNL